MKPDSRRYLRLRQSLFLVLLALIVISAVLALTRRGAWLIPEEAAQRPNPLQPSPAALQAAHATYKEKCAHCHGDSGRGDGPDAWKHFTSPSDLTDTRRMNTLTDGGIFYEISEGRQPMPSYKTRLTEEQRWQLVLLLRSFTQVSEVQKKNP